MTVLDELKKLSAAEDFFKCLGVSYDPAVLNVARLHILKRMGQYLRRETHEGLDDQTARARCRAYLEQAYADFIASTPIEQRVFKVLQDAVRPAGETFVPLSSLTVGNEAPE
jgi:nitrogenase-stabilizing/protective protein